MNMKVLISSFVLHAVLITISVSLFMIARMNIPCGIICVGVASIAIGFGGGLIGMVSGHFFYKRNYLAAGVVTAILLALIPIVLGAIA